MKKRRLCLILLLFAFTFAKAQVSSTADAPTKPPVFSHQIEVDIKALGKSNWEVYTGKKIQLNSTPVASSDPDGNDLYQIADGVEVTVKYTITNLSKEPQNISIRDTPLENKMHTNFTSTMNAVFPGRSTIITEEHGSFNITTLEPGSALSSAPLPIHDILIFQNKSPISLQLSFTLYLPDRYNQTEKSDDVEYLWVETNQVPLYFDLLPTGRFLEQSSDFKNDGVPRYDPPNDNNWASPSIDRTFSFESCTDQEKSKTVDAERLKKKRCRDILYQLKQIKTSSATNIDRKVMALFTKWFGFTTSTFTEKIFDKFYKGYLKICSADNYEYVCAPPIETFSKPKKDRLGKVQYEVVTERVCTIAGLHNCTGDVVPARSVRKATTLKMDFYQGNYTTWTTNAGYEQYGFEFQIDVVNELNSSTCNRDEWVKLEGIKVQKGYYTQTLPPYVSATVAYVSPSDTEKKTINNCRLGYWSENHDDDKIHEKSMASTIVHELTHFNDICATVDVTYSAKTIKKHAANTPSGSMLNNAQSWAFFFSDTAWENIKAPSYWTDWPPTDFENPPPGKLDDADREAHNLNYLDNRSGSNGTSSSGTRSGAGSGTLSTDIDCTGYWKTCAGNCKKTFKVTRKKIGNGARCQHTTGETKACSAGEGSCPQNIDCVGKWQPVTKCTANCEISFIITTPANGNGALCSFRDRQTMACRPGEGSCPQRTHQNSCKFQDLPYSNLKKVRGSHSGTKGFRIPFDCKFDNVNNAWVRFYKRKGSKYTADHFCNNGTWTNSQPGNCCTPADCNKNGAASGIQPNCSCSCTGDYIGTKCETVSVGSKTRSGGNDKSSSSSNPDTGNKDSSSSNQGNGVAKDRQDKGSKDDETKKSPQDDLTNIEGDDDQGSGSDSNDDDQGSDFKNINILIVIFINVVFIYN